MLKDYPKSMGKKITIWKKKVESLPQSVHQKNSK